MEQGREPGEGGRENHAHTHEQKQTGENRRHGENTMENTIGTARAVTEMDITECITIKDQMKIK